MARTVSDPFYKAMEPARTFSLDGKLTPEVTAPFIEEIPGARYYLPCGCLREADRDGCPSGTPAMMSPGCCRSPFSCSEGTLVPTLEVQLAGDSVTIRPILPSVVLVPFSPPG